MLTLFKSESLYNTEKWHEVFKSKSFYNTEKWQARPNAYLEQVNLYRKIKIKIYRII
jgi:hypothetical protein